METSRNKAMIKSFSNKALRAFWETGDARKLPPEAAKRLAKILNLIDATSKISDLYAVSRSYRLHQLKKPPYDGFWSMDVTGNYRVIFRLSDGDAHDVDFLDTH